MSVHGICFDNGQSGRCNLECELFIEGGCPIADEMIECFEDEFMAEYMDRFKLAVLEKQTHLTDEEYKKLKHMFISEAALNEFGYKI